jgi:hypothetical protein
MKIKFLVLMLLISFNGFAQETKVSRWAFGLSNGHSQSRVNAENNLLSTSVDAFYIDRYEWFWLRPEIRLYGNKGFWILRFNAINSGHTSFRNSSHFSDLYDFRNFDFTLSRNHKLKSWKKATLFTGLSFSYSYLCFEGNEFSYRNEERRHTLNLEINPRYSFSISKHVQLEFATEFRIAEFAKVHEAFFSNYNQWFEINDYHYLMDLNGFAYSLNLVYQL